MTSASALRRARRARSVPLGWLVDQVVGELPLDPHPVALFGELMAGVERRIWADRRGPGIAYAAGGVALGALAGSALASAPGAAYVAIGHRRLLGEAAAIAEALERGDLPGARERLPALVGRDPRELGLSEVCRAVVESVAENTVDAAVAPMLWGALGGAPAALGYRALNTMDAMVGHRASRYERFGWASARLDDVAAWLPARVTAALVAAVRPRRALEVAAAVRRQAPAHPSPNAGVAEAAFAAALDLRLGGTNRYGERVEVRPALGTGQPPGVADLWRAARLSREVGAALCAALVGASLLGRKRARPVPAVGTVLG